MSKKKKKSKFYRHHRQKKRTETAFLNGGRENKAGFVEEGDTGQGTTAVLEKEEGGRRAGEMSR